MLITPENVYVGVEIYLRNWKPQNEWKIGIKFGEKLLSINEKKAISTNKMKKTS